MELWNNINYTSDISYLNNVFIYEMDLSKANINVLRTKNIIDQKTTVRSTAQKFGVSKSTVHKDVSERLKYVNPQLYTQVKKILEINKSQRHIRGGMATRRKYKGIS